LAGLLVEEELFAGDPPAFAVGSAVLTAVLAALSSFWSTLALALALIRSMMLWECATGTAVPTRQPVSTIASQVLVLMGSLLWKFRSPNVQLCSAAYSSETVLRRKNLALRRAVTEVC
jgi:uncharacterized membrane protein